MKGMIFGSESIKAMLEDRKTMTRQLGGLKEINKNQDKLKYRLSHLSDGVFYFDYGDCYFTSAKPRYKKGEVVYVKEAYRVLPCTGDFEKPTIIYKINSGKANATEYSWKNKLFMPEWASRIKIKITDVRVERVMDISLEDIEREGISDNRDTGNARAQSIKFQHEWDKINKKYPWKSNPWIWVYTFEVIK